MERKKKQGGVLRTILKYRSVVIGVLVSTLVLLALLVLSRPLDTEAVERAVRAHGHSTRTLRDGGFGSDKEQQAVVNQVEQGLDPAGAEVRTDSLKLLLASHGRLMWYFPHTNRVRVLHEGGVSVRTCSMGYMLACCILATTVHVHCVPPRQRPILGCILEEP